MDQASFYNKSFRPSNMLVAAIMLIALVRTHCVSALLSVDGNQVDERHLRRSPSYRRPKRPARLRGDKKATSGHHGERHRFPHKVALVFAVESAETVVLQAKLSSAYESEENADKIRNSLFAAYNAFQSSCTTLVSMAPPLETRDIIYANDQENLTMCVQTSCTRNCSALLFDQGNGDDENTTTAPPVVTTRQLVRNRPRRRNNGTVALASSSQQLVPSTCKKPTQREVVDRVNAKLDVESRVVIIDIIVLMNDKNSCAERQQTPTMSSRRPSLPSPMSNITIAPPTVSKIESPSLPAVFLSTKVPTKIGVLSPTRSPRTGTPSPVESIPRSHTPSFRGDVGTGSQKPIMAKSISSSVSQSPSFSPSALSGFPTVTLPIEWIQRGQTFVGDNSGDGLGRSLSVSSDGLTIVAGARGNDEGGDLAGVVRAYSLIDDKWVSQTVSLGNAGDVFGTSVSISGDGNTVAVGAMGPVQNVEQFLRNGYAKVYTTKLENWAWTQLGQTLLYDILGDGFGITVALSSSGNILAVGAHGGVVTTGYVRVFRLVDSDWVRLGSSVPANLPSNDRDRIMSLSGDGLTVAVVSNDYVKVFTFDVNNDEWMALSDPPMSPAEDIVLSLSHDGTTLAVGSWQRHIVRILNYRNGSWVITKDITGGKIGFSVSVSPGGNYLAVGGVHTVQIFALEDNQWVELRGTGIQQEIKSLFGSAVALSSENGLSIVTGNPAGFGQIESYFRVA